MPRQSGVDRAFRAHVPAGVFLECESRMHSGKQYNGHRCSEYDLLYLIKRLLRTLSLILSSQVYDEDTYQLIHGFIGPNPVS